ncbi:NADP-dependent oxidoreductase [Streptomyces sp. NPDC004539]|uniref:NADP-dependent oxidoreductase n=1 Tax=Streptomyces sp. NPDC004539 TaxID=3154280 RepID=UPI0033A1A394
MTHTSSFVWLNQYVPSGPVEPWHFSTSTRELPDLREGQVLARPVVFSVDPTLRGQLTGIDSPIHPQVRLGAAIVGHAVAEVVESRADGVRPGDLVTGRFDWADLAVWPPQEDSLSIELQQVEAGIGTPSHALAVLGLTGGLTAYTGMIGAGGVQAGETVVVSAAAGNVGSLAGQIAKIRGARVIGLAGTEGKRRVLRERLGFDAALDYRAPDLAEQIRKHAPDGVDLYYDNVGGSLGETVMDAMKQGARIVACGLISTFNDADSLMIDSRPLIRGALTLRFFTPLHFAGMFPAARTELTEWVREGKILPLTTERHGLEALPGAFSGMMRGENMGKMLVTMP